MTAVISICNWQRFQHYKDRDPPWVKFYRDILTSESWMFGTDASRLVQAASVLLAPRYGNEIPARFDLWKKVAHLDMSEPQFKEAVKHLAATKFLSIHEVTEEVKIAEQSASAPLASCSSEKSREEKRRGEERESARAREGPRGTPNGNDGVIHVGDNLTKNAEEIWNASLNSWREDNPGINAEKFSEWLSDLERRGKSLQPHARCLQARFLCQQGTAAEQAEIVDHCMANEYRRLIPLGDVRGKASAKPERKRWHPDDGDPTAVAATRLV